MQENQTPHNCMLEVTHSSSILASRYNPNYAELSSVKEIRQDTVHRKSTQANQTPRNCILHARIGYLGFVTKPG